MTTYDLTKKTNASTGSIVVSSKEEIRIQNLENKVEEQSDKLDQITSLLNEISKKTSAS
jgi:hypothetical protein